MAVEMDKANPLLPCNTPEYGIGDGVVSSRGDRDDAGGRNFSIECLDVLQGFFQVAGSPEVNVPNIGHPEIGERAHLHVMVVGSHHASLVPDLAGAKARSSPDSHPKVEGCACERIIRVF